MTSLWWQSSNNFIQKDVKSVKWKARSLRVGAFAKQGANESFPAFITDTWSQNAVILMKLTACVLRVWQTYRERRTPAGHRGGGRPGSECKKKTTQGGRDFFRGSGEGLSAPGEGGLIGQFHQTRI